MDRDLLKRVIDRKKKALKNYTLEQMGIAGFIGGFVGLILGEMYSNMIGGLALHILNVFIYGAVGAAIGYFTSKNKKEDIEAELMLLESFYNKQG